MAKSNSICSIPDCGKYAFGRGLCQNHYYRLRTHGDPLGGRESPGKLMRFIEDIALRWESDDCLKWPFSTNNAGYGQISVSGKRTYAHRYVCELTHGVAPTTDHEAAHSCGKGHLGCVNPKHLSWKTPKENQADRIAHGTDMRGELHPSSKLTKEQVLEIISLKGSATQSEIARMFGVSQPSICLIHRGKNWAFVSPE